MKTTLPPREPYGPLPGQRQLQPYTGPERKDFDVHLMRWTYHVRWVKDLMKTEKLYGDVDYETRVIRIDADIPADEAQDTLIHECIHAISEAFDLGISEMKTRILGTALQCMLQDALLKDI